MKNKNSLMLIELFHQAGILKRTKRTGWLDKVGIYNPESVADHSYRVALIGSILGDILGLDAGRIVKMALIHDLGESLTGDITPDEVSRGRDKKAEETEAMHRILSMLPQQIRSIYQDLWNEWVSAQTNESRFLREIDALEMALQADEYAKAGYDQTTLNQFKKSAERQIHDPTIKYFLARVLVSES